MLVNKNLLREAVMLDEIKKLIIKDTIEIVPELIEKLKEFNPEESDQEEKKQKHLITYV